MTWLKNESPPLICECKLPTREKVTYVPCRGELPPLVHRVMLVPDGPGGALWLCDDCTAVWQIRRRARRRSDHPNIPIAVGAPYWHRLNRYQAWRARRKHELAIGGGWST